jgi:hypothetical protein
MGAGLGRSRARTEPARIGPGSHRISSNLEGAGCTDKGRRGHGRGLQQEDRLAALAAAGDLLVVTGPNVLWARPASTPPAPPTTTVAHQVKATPACERRCSWPLITPAKVDPTLAGRYQRLTTDTARHHTAALCTIAPCCSPASSPACAAGSLGRPIKPSQGRAIVAQRYRTHPRSALPVGRSDSHSGMDQQLGSGQSFLVLQLTPFWRRLAGRAATVRRLQR